MDGQDPKSKRSNNHGLRLVKGGANDNRDKDRTDRTVTGNVTDGATPKRIRNPLLAQLNALADAIDHDVNQILNF